MSPSSQPCHTSRAITTTTQSSQHTTVDISLQRGKEPNMRANICVIPKELFATPSHATYMMWHHQQASSVLQKTSTKVGLVTWHRGYVEIRGQSWIVKRITLSPYFFLTISNPHSLSISSPLQQDCTSHSLQLYHTLEPSAN